MIKGTGDHLSRQLLPHPKILSLLSETGEWSELSLRVLCHQRSRWSDIISLLRKVLLQTSLFIALAILTYIRPAMESIMDVTYVRATLANKVVWKAVRTIVAITTRQSAWKSRTNRGLAEYRVAFAAGRRKLLRKAHSPRRKSTPSPSSNRWHKCAMCYGHKQPPATCFRARKCYQRLKG